jgi:hypothetical protein
MHTAEECPHDPLSLDQVLFDKAREVWMAANLAPGESV